MKKNRRLTLDEVFWAYQQPGLVGGSTIWTRFDEEFVRVLNERGMDGKALSKEIGVDWNVLNSGSRRNKSPAWMTADVLSCMVGFGFDVGYVLGISALKTDEAALLDNYRNATPAGQASLREVGAAFAQQAEAMKKTG